MGVRFRETKDKIGDYKDSMDNINESIKTLKEKVEILEERLSKAEGIIKIIHYESNPAYLEGLKFKYEEMYGDKDE